MCLAVCRVFTGFRIFRGLKVLNTTKHKLHTAKHKLHTKRSNSIEERATKAKGSRPHQAKLRA